MKTRIVCIIIAVAVLAFAGIGIGVVNSEHEHSFGPWQTKTPATCVSAEVEVRTCACGQEETREGDPANGEHNMAHSFDATHHWEACSNEGCDKMTEKEPHSTASISVETALETPMATMVLQPEDLSVTAVCGVCGGSYAVTEGIEVDSTPLVLGKNTLTVRCGEFSAELTVEAAALDVVLDAVISDDAYVSADKKDNEYTQREELGTNSSSFRTYFRVNVSDVLSNYLFEANRDKAKLQLTLAITSGEPNEESTFTLKAYTPAEGVTDISFKDLTWNNVDNKKKSLGEYNALHWHNGTVLVSGEPNYNVSVDEKQITFTFAYSQIEPFVDENGDILFAFATNTKGLKIGSLESKNAETKPTVKILLNDEHFHVFDQQVKKEAYLISAKCGEKTKYYQSCVCGEAGTETFTGSRVPHSYVSVTAQSKLLTPMAGMTLQPGDLRVTAVCKCGAKTVVTNGVQVESKPLVLGQNTLTVTYGKLSTTITIDVDKTGTLLTGNVREDTYISSSKKDEANPKEVEMGTKSDLYRIYLRANLNSILSDSQFSASQAKLQLTFTITSGAVNADSTFTLKAFAPAAGVTDAPFSALTWNSVNDKEGAVGKYSKLNWKQGTVLAAGGAGQNVSVQNGCITLTVAYSQVAPFVDSNGDVVFVFASNTKGLKVGSLENKNEANRPTLKVVLSDEHLHVFDREVAQEQYLASAAACGEKAKYYKTCACGEIGTETFEYGEATPHSFIAITAVSKLDSPTAGTELKAENLLVTAACGCGANVTLTEGFQLEGDTKLVPGENRFTVRYGSLTATVSVDAVVISAVLDGTVQEDTYVSSSNKNTAYADKTELGTKSDSFRAYFRLNVRDILADPLFEAGRAKVQLVLTVTSGAVADTTTYTLKAYTPATGVTDTAFSNLTWNSVDNKTGSVGQYSKLNWNSGKVLEHNATAKDGKITLVLNYGELAPFVDENGSVVLAFATNTKNLKVGSLENQTAASRPVFKVALNDEHVHIFSKEVADIAYLQAEATCEKPAVYFKSCDCGAAGTETFEAGEALGHNYVETATIAATCTEDAVQVMTCACGAEQTQPVAGTALGHAMVLRYDEQNHWTQCEREGCGETTEPEAHAGGTATEEEQAVCDTCGQHYGTLASHVHEYVDTLTLPTCTEGGYTTHTCACGDSYTDTPVYPLGHDEVTHAAQAPTCTEPGWEEYVTCTRCDHTTFAEIAALGHTWEELDEDRVKCTACSLEKTRATVSGSIQDDTYVDSSSANKGKDFSTSKTELNIRVKGSNNFRSYFRFDFSELLNAEGFAQNADSAKIKFTFRISTGSAPEGTSFTFKVFDPENYDPNVAFSAINWNSVDGLGLGFSGGIKLNGTVYADENVVTVTLPYSAIQDYIDAEGRAIFALTSTSTDLKVASMENTGYAHPAVTGTYLK